MVDNMGKYERILSWNKLIAWLFLSLYVVSRVYLLWEAFAGREVPASVYDQV